MRRFLSPLLFMTFFAVPTRAQVITDMTAKRIEEAIAAGRQQRPAPYAVRTPHLWMEFDTPFLRVSQRAAASPASADASLATPDLVAPEMRIVAAPEPLSADVPGIEKVLAERPDGSTISPLSQSSTLEYAQSSRRKKIAIHGVKAVFPIAVLVPGVRFHFVLSKGPEQVLTVDPEWFRTPR